MSRSGMCYACGVHFGFFKKENGCKHCGFAFCSKCLTKVFDPIEKGGKCKNRNAYYVCQKCHDISTSRKTKPQQETGRYSPPEAYKKRIAALEKLTEDGSSTTVQSTCMASISNSRYANPDIADRHIVERLEKLKERPKDDPVSDTVLYKRLCQLKEENQEARITHAHNVCHLSDKHTQVDQVDDLLHEVINEVEIDSHGRDTVTDIENRLRMLRQNRPGCWPARNVTDTAIDVTDTAIDVSSGDEDDDTAAVSHIVEQYIEEAKLDAKSGYRPSIEATCSSNQLNMLLKEDSQPGTAGLPLEDADHDDSSELPYCCICTENAVLRCIDCDMDLYCSRCSRDFHQELSLVNHRTKKYIQPRGYKS